MYCINYGSFDYGQGRSGRLSHKTPSKYAKGQPAVDTSLPPAELIADSNVTP